MVFIFDEDAGKEELRLKKEEFKYLIKVRRHQEGDEVAFRSIKDPKTLYTYKIEQVLPREAYLRLIDAKEYELKSEHQLTLGWCVIDPKSVEKILPTLNEIGVAKIAFIYCDRSQKNFKIDQKRLYRILQASMQQCGRSVFMEFAFYDDIEAFLKEHPEVVVLDFAPTILESDAKPSCVLLGCEGGFSKEEKELLANYKVRRFNTSLILRSESAAAAIAAKVLL